MKKEVNFSRVLLLIFIALSLVGCKKEKITLSEYEFWFPGEACVQNIQVTANCDWTISIDDGADWYSIKKSIDTTVYSEYGSSTYFIIYNTAQTISSGQGSMTLAIVVEPLENQLERSSSFTITSDKGNVQLKVRVSQNTDDSVELRSIENMVFGVATFTHWNVDYFGEVIEETYKRIRTTRQWAIRCISWKIPSAYKKTTTRTARCTISSSTFMTPMLVSSISILL